jgi:hypothetical protein
MEGKMETKNCSKCGEEKPITTEYFQKRKNGKGGWQASCKICWKAYYQSRKDKEAARKKVYYENNKEKVSARNKKYRENNREKLIEAQRKYYRENTEACLASSKRWVENNKEKDAATKKAYYEANKEKIKEDHKRHYENNREQYRIRSRKNERKRRQDPAYRMASNVSRAIRGTFNRQKQYKKDKSVWSALPYTKDELKKHLENQFEPWMTWENYGTKWNIDHITPQSFLQFNNYEHPNFLKCWALSNLRPLCVRQNTSEGNRRSKEEIEILKATNKKTIDIERQDGYAYVSQ